MKSSLLLGTFCAAILTFSCSGSNGQAAIADDHQPASTGPSASGTPTKLPPLGPNKKKQPLPSHVIKKHMQDQMTAVSAIHMAVIHGDLTSAKKQAQWLLSLRGPTLPPEWNVHILKMKSTATELAQAKDLEIAAQKTATLGRRCAQCHDDLTALVTFEWFEPPPKTGDTKTMMRRHQWAAGRLWEGLVAPSDVLWNRGAEALAADSIDVDRAVGGKAPPEATRLAARIRKLGQRAKVTVDAQGRTALTGELLSTCSQCHRLVRPTPQSLLPETPRRS